MSRTDPGGQHDQKAEKSGHSRAVPELPSEPGEVGSDRNDHRGQDGEQTDRLPALGEVDCIGFLNCFDVQRGQRFAFADNVLTGQETDFFFLDLIASQLFL